jgi:hypothetical protein
MGFAFLSETGDFSVDLVFILLSVSAVFVGGFEKLWSCAQAASAVAD